MKSKSKSKHTSAQKGTAKKGRKEKRSMKARGVKEDLTLASSILGPLALAGVGAYAGYRANKAFNNAKNYLTNNSKGTIARDGAELGLSSIYNAIPEVKAPSYTKMIDNFSDNKSTYDHRATHTIGRDPFARQLAGSGPEAYNPLTGMGRYAIGIKKGRSLLKSIKGKGMRKAMKGGSMNKTALGYNKIAFQPISHGV